MPLKTAVRCGFFCGLDKKTAVEVIRHKGKCAAFLSHCAIPDRVKHALRNEVPMWVIASVMALMGMLGFIALRGYLDHETGQVLSGYQQIVKLAPRMANVTITLP